MQLGDAALVRVALHAPLEGPLVLGSVLAGTFDFRASQIASSSGTPKCIQVQRSEVEHQPCRALTTLPISAQDMCGQCCLPIREAQCKHPDASLLVQG